MTRHTSRARPMTRNAQPDDGSRMAHRGTSRAHEHALHTTRTRNQMFSIHDGDWHARATKCCHS
eukprot:scaffold13502_cov109-Isochrysis_galbana.AAC.4